MLTLFGGAAITDIAIAIIRRATTKDRFFSYLVPPVISTERVRFLNDRN